LLADVSNAISEEKVSIISGQMTAMKDVTATLIMTIEVTSQSQYDRVLGRIKAVRGVIDVRRGH
jgi:GTP pyrophosphokinase